jgi:hypothetical protein
MECLTDDGFQPVEGSANQFTETTKIICIVDRAQPITPPKNTEDCILRWSMPNSRFRKVLEVTPGVVPDRTVSDIIDDWARSSGQGDRGSRLQFGRTQLYTSSRLLELLRRSLRKDSQARIAFTGIVELVQKLSERANVTDPELRDMVGPIVVHLPEAAVFRVAEAMWEEWQEKKKQEAEEQSTNGTDTASASPQQLKQKQRQKKQKQKQRQTSANAAAASDNASPSLPPTAPAADASSLASATDGDETNAQCDSDNDIETEQSTSNDAFNTAESTIQVAMDADDASADVATDDAPAVDQDSAMSESEPSDTEADPVISGETAVTEQA